MNEPRNLKYGTRVQYGFTTGEVICTERKHGIDGVKVYERGSCYSRWVPLTSITVIEDSLR